MKRKKAEHRVGIGASSVLMILVVLALATLSLLAFGSAKSTEALTRRNVEMACAYYEAAARTQEKLMQIDQAVLDYRRQGTGALDAAWFDAYPIAAQWDETEDGLCFTLLTEAGEGRVLCAAGVVHEQGTARYTLNKHVLISDASEDTERYLNLIGQE